MRQQRLAVAVLTAAILSACGRPPERAGRAPAASTASTVPGAQAAAPQATDCTG